MIQSVKRAVKTNPRTPEIALHLTQLDQYSKYFGEKLLSNLLFSWILENYLQ